MFNKGSQGCYRGSSLLDKIPQPKNVIEFEEKKITAVVKLSKDVSDEILKKTVEEQGYTVIG